DHGFGDFVWLRPDLYFPFTLPVLVRDTAEVPLQGWEAGEVHAWLDQDSMQATFSLAGRTVLTAPLEPMPGVAPTPSSAASTAPRVAAAAAAGAS
ncbi:MAG: hypothetical protein JO247_02730, partial [Chloroflexi bacterium]|nr:hypothetical protein [Chloroflexota bacterium]